MKKTALTEMLGMKYPIIMAPMFLVTNDKMMIAAGAAGIAGAIPAHNFKSLDELELALKKIRSETTGPIGVNIITNKANIKAKDELKICIKAKVDFIITALGSPETVINEAHKHGIKVFCDVVDAEYAKKVEQLGADALIAVNNGAGGHLGQIPATVLIPMLRKQSKLPIISAGGVNNGEGILSILALGADGLSMGSPFIASTESPVNPEYKNAVLQYGAHDIVVTTKISGTPCTVINTDYVKKIGTEQNFLENFLNNHKQIKKYAKMLTYYQGMKLLEKAAFGATYKSVWCAGPSIQFSEDIRPIKEIVEVWIEQMARAQERLNAIT